MSAIQVGEEVSIIGNFVRNLYDADGFRIIHVLAPYTPEKFPSACKDSFVEFTAKGKFAAPDYQGQTMEFVGEWRYDNKYKSFALVVAYTIPSLPKTEDDSLKFMKSIKGIGERLSKRVCKAFRGDLEKAAEDPDVLVGTVKGMRKSSAEALCDAVKRVNICAEMTKLLKDKVSSDAIRAVAVKYGSDAMDVIRENPYKMVMEHCVSFKDADAIAVSLGWSFDSPQRLTVGVLSSLRALKARNAAIIVDKNMLTKTALRLLNVDESLIAQTAANLQQSHDIVSAGNYWYLREDYCTEKQLADIIVEYSQKTIAPKDSQKYLDCFSLWEKKHPDMKLAENQAEAVKAVADNHLSVVTGGPGTGKTSTMKAIMETYQMAFPKSKITLMAPTGLASKRMSESCGMPAMTIHKTLCLTPSDCDAGFDDSCAVSINGGLIIIDEFSMVGIHLAKFLMDSIVYDPDVRIVIVGDIDQLPPVSPGAVLDDLIQCKAVKVTRLTRNFRQEAGSAIVDAAYAINAGDTSRIPYNKGNFHYREIANKDIDVETQEILDTVTKAFRWSIDKFGLDQTYILAPQRRSEVKDGKTTTKTLLSTASLNPILRDIANPAEAGKAFFKAGNRIFRVGDRVMNMKNAVDVMNGDIGIITRIETGDVSSVFIDFDGTEIEFTPDRVKQLELAYAITVHKSQGCEYDSVIYPSCMTQGVMLQKNLLYTAVTRAKKSVLIIGSRTSVNKAVTTVGAKNKRDLLAARIARGVQKNSEAFAQV